MRIIGIDSSVRSTGVGIIEVTGNSLKLVEALAFTYPANMLRSECLRRLNKELSDALVRYAPQEASLEGVFYCRNAKTALMLGEARGVAIAACAGAGLPVFEYSPRRVKQALVGYGDADKEQVARMVIRILGLKELPQADAADALAIAICHAQSRRTIAPVAPEPI